MPIRSYLDEPAAFNPDAISAMSEALEDACAALGITADQEHERQVIAARIIDLARQGILDSKTLIARVVETMRSL